MTEQPALPAGPTSRKLPPEMADSWERLTAMNDQIGAFHAIRAIITNPDLVARAKVRDIRAVYAAFDAKHPNAPKGDQQ